MTRNSTRQVQGTLRMAVLFKMVEGHSYEVENYKHGCGVTWMAVAASTPVTAASMIIFNLLITNLSGAIVNFNVAMPVYF